MKKGRVERDALGEVTLPAGAYYGIQTARAVGNFPISGWRSHPFLIDAYMHQKKASALANRDVGALPARLAEAIASACDEVLEEKLRDQFVVDVFQAGAGVSQHMNVNEVLANRAAELLGGKRGDYSLVHPNDHVNFGQSTNDTYPTAMRVSALRGATEVDGQLTSLKICLEGRANAFDHIVKAGRTHLQDAVPIGLGQEMRGYWRAIHRGQAVLKESCRHLEELGLGGTAVGTGLNAAPGYRKRAIEYLREFTGLDLRPAPDMREAMQSCLPVAAAASALRIIALELIRITNDLRLMASGPRTGLGEIVLPAVQAGSSIMPGKVNPAILEMTAMVCFHVVGCAAAVDLAVQAGQLELNVMMPLMAFEILTAMEILRTSLNVLNGCVAGIVADEDRCRSYAEATPALVTALNPLIGYAKGAEVAREALATGKSIRQIVKERGLLSEEELEKILDPSRMTGPAFTGKE